MTRAEVATLFQAEALALRAKCGRVEASDLRSLGDRVAQHAPLGPIGLILAEMVAARRDPGALRACGDRLQASVAAALIPQPVDLHRVDIHG